MTEQKEYTLDDMREGAEAAVRTCMAVQPDERVLILGDESSCLISQALADAAGPIAAQVEILTLESLGTRPITAMPDGLLSTLERFQPHVSFYTASSRPGELKFRMAYMPAVMQANPGGARHGHMINITPAADDAGYAGRLPAHLRSYDARPRNCAPRLLRSGSPTQKAPISRRPSIPISTGFPVTALYHEPGQWGNLPEGETFTSPQNANGELVVDELGDYFSERYGILDTPVTLDVAEGKVRAVRCEDTALQEDVRSYIFGAENADRVGEFAIGTNIALTGLVGNLLQDEKFPGMHVAFGDPYGKQTGADWKSVHHVDVIPTLCTIEVDGRRIMSDGVFVAEILGT